MAQLPAPLQVILQSLRDWWDEWFNMLVVGLAWLLCLLTVLLGPPATLGLYHVTHALAHGESLGLSGLFAGGRNAKVLMVQCSYHLRRLTPLTPAVSSKR